MGGPRRSGAAFAVVAAVVIGVAPQQPASAAIPAVQTLASRVTSGVAVDIDRDGAREIVAVRPGVASPTLEVEAWTDRDGRWESTGTALVMVADGPARDLRLGRIGADAATLLVAAVNGQPHAVLATAPIDGEGLAACCLTLFEVVIGRGALELTVVGSGLGVATSVRALDLEADGTDELLVSAPVDPAGPAAPFESIQVLRRLGERYDADPIIYPEDAGSLAAVGDADGVPGDEILFATSRTITRFSADERGLRAEDQPLSGLIEVIAGGWVVGATGGTIVAVDGDRSLRTATWPRGGHLAPARSVATSRFPSTFLLGDGPDARIAVLAGEFPADDRTLVVRVYDLDLGDEREIVAPPDVQALWNAAVFGPPLVARTFERARPAFGPVSGAAEGAFLGAGAIVRLDASGELAVETARPFAGSGAMALAGRGAEWLVSGMGWNSLSDSIGYIIGSDGGTELISVPLEQLIGSAEAMRPDVRLAGAATVDDPAGSRLYTSGDGFSVVVTARPDASVIGAAGQAADEAVVVDDPVTLHLRPEAELAEPGTEFEATVAIVDPSGVVSAATWTAVMLAGPPDLRVRASTEPLTATTIVAGRVSEGSSLTVDGRPVTAAEDGTFTAAVEAPIWGRAVRVVARDVLGRQSTERLTVIGFVDYRELPWLPIIASGTALMGAALYLRAPQRQSATGAAGADGDGRLEEIDADGAAVDNDA